MGIVNFSIPVDLVLKIMDNFDIHDFVETGTYKGDTCFWAAKHFKKVYTIEIDPGISHETAKRKDCPSNIEFIVGNSKDILPGLVTKLDDNAFFWLDGHWCVGGGGKEEECPLLDELKALSKLKNPTIFIDDARCFMGPMPPPHNSDHWPGIDDIFHILRVYFPNHSTTIQDDVIMCIPEEVKKIIDMDWSEKYGKRFNTSVKINYSELSISKLIKLLIKRLFFRNV